MNITKPPSPLRYQTNIIYDETGKEKYIDIYYPIPIKYYINEINYDDYSFSDSEVDIDFEINLKDEPYSSTESQSEEYYDRNLITK